MEPPVIPDHDQVLDGTSDLLLGLPEWCWTIIAAILLAIVVKVMIKQVNFIMVSAVLAVLFLGAYYGYFGKG